MQWKPGASGGSSAFSVKDLNFLMAQTCVWGDWVGGEGGVQRLQMVPPGSEVSAPPRARGGGTEVPGHPGAKAYAAGSAQQDLRSGGLALAGLVACLPPSLSQHRRPEFAPGGKPTMGFTSCPLPLGGPVLAALNSSQIRAQKFPSCFSSHCFSIPLITTHLRF